MAPLSKPSYLDFDKKSYAWHKVVYYRRHPELYLVGKGEQGVLICEPYKTEIGRHWRFKTQVIAKESAKVIFKMFEDYLAGNEFVGADMARKYLQMGYTRARRYANYKGGRKFDKGDNYRPLDRGTGEPEKAEAAAIFYNYWKQAEANQQYAVMKKQWKADKG